MPHPVTVTWDVAPHEFPPGTPIPASYALSINDGVSLAVDVPYGGPHEGIFPSVPQGHWTVGVDMKEPDGTHIGTLVTGTVDVPADNVVLAEPISVHLSVAA